MGVYQQRQDLLTQTGIGAGLVESGFDDVQGFVQLFLHPVDTVKAIGKLIDDPQVLAGYPAEVRQQLQEKLARVETALIEGGDDNAMQLGRDLGELVWDVGGLVTGVGGVAKGGVKLAKAGVKLGTDKLEQMAERQTLKNLEWAAKDGPYSASQPAGYGSQTVTLNGQTVKNPGDFSSMLPESAVKPPLRVVEMESGSKGDWAKGLNKPEPNTVYKVDGDKVYRTDELGRVDKVESTLTLNTKDRNKYQQCKAGKCGVEGDEGGHLIASIFNGPGESLNILPMNGNLNKGAWKVMENEWASALKKGDSVSVKIEPNYTGSSVRPDSFTVDYQIGRGRPVQEIFINAPGAYD